MTFEKILTLSAWAFVPLLFSQSCTPHGLPFRCPYLLRALGLLMPSIIGALSGPHPSPIHAYLFTRFASCSPPLVCPWFSLRVSLRFSFPAASDGSSWPRWELSTVVLARKSNTPGLLFIVDRIVALFGPSCLVFLIVFTVYCLPHILLPYCELPLTRASESSSAYLRRDINAALLVSSYR
jgi:hypothetical protein